MNNSVLRELATAPAQIEDVEPRSLPIAWTIDVWLELGGRWMDRYGRTKQWGAADGKSTVHGNVSQEWRPYACGSVVSWEDYYRMCAENIKTTKSLDFFEVDTTL